MRNICFICSIDRNTFDKYSDGFERHIARDHNLWQYVFYIVHLQSKDSTDYTGIESYVQEMVSVCVYMLFSTSRVRSVGCL